MTPSLDLVERAVALCRALRARGLPVTTAHAADAVRTLGAVPLGERAQVHLGLRCVLASRPEDYPVFDALFAEAFSLERAEAGRAKGGPPRLPPREGPRATPQLSVARWLNQGEAAELDDDDAPADLRAASAEAARAQKDFSTFTEEELAGIGRVARRLARKLAVRPGRRWKPARRGARVDLRRTVRRSLGTGAEPVSLSFRRRKPRRTRIVALCDVSGSMDLYSRFLLQFLYALQGTFARVESFVFATELRRVTSLLDEATYAAALRGLSRGAHGWSGGTRIGACLSALLEEHPEVLDRRTVVVILSDGWDTGAPEELSQALAAIRANSRRVVWLNPLLGSPGYEPLASGMQAALPHLDVFAPAHNLDALRALEQHLLL